MLWCCVLLHVVVCLCLLGQGWDGCMHRTHLRVYVPNALRVNIQNIPVCTGITPTCCLNMRKSVSLKSAIRVRQNSRKEHSKELCNKKDAPAEKHGTWRRISASSITTPRPRSTPTEAWVMPALFEKARGTIICGRFRNIDAHAERKGVKLR